MKYKSLIESKFSKFEFAPQNNQLELSNRILSAYIDEHKKYVILSSPTGSGKSIVAVIISECLHELTHSPDTKKKSYILMNSNVLVNQYHKTFSKYSDFIQVRGANNYKCSVLNSTADTCIHSQIKHTNQVEHCINCEYLKIKNEKLTYPHIITNYAYYLTAKLYSPHILDRRLLTVFDEAHNINEIFCNHMEIKLSNFIFKKNINILKEDVWGIGNDILTEMRDLSSKLKCGMVNLNNYEDYLNQYFNLIGAISAKFEDMATHAASVQDYNSYIKYNSKVNYFNAALQKYYDWKNYKYKHVVDVKDNYITISPIFIGNMFNKIEHSDYFLFMSGTIDNNFISKTLNLNPSEIKFIRNDPVFKPTTKEISFFNHMSYNYKSLQSKQVLSDISSIAAEIMNENKNKRGIILTPSFYLNHNIASFLKKKSNLKIIEHEQGTKLEDHLKTYLNTPGPCILISPSLFEGIDLPNKLSEYQIMIKAPYPSLGDKRIKYIFDNYNDIYKTYTIYKIIQGFGRSTRHENDYSITFCLDTNLKRLFYDKMNYWKNEFNII